MFPQKLRLFGELRRFRRHHDFRAEISVLRASESSNFDETEPSYELLSGHVRILCKTTVPVSARTWGTSTLTPFDGEAPSTLPLGDLPPRAFLARSC